MPNQVFVSYSHKDKKWLDALRIHLKPLIRDERIRVWDDTRIREGQIWRDEIRAALATASVAVLLVSPDFLASDFIAEDELPQLLDAARRGGVTILWVAVRYSSYKHSKIEPYQAANDPQTPLASLRPSQRERAFVEICELILRATTGAESEPEIQNRVIEPNRSQRLVEGLPVFPTVAARIPKGRFYDEQSRKSGIAIHHTVGRTALSTLKWWAEGSPAAKVAAAYVIERDGTIFEAFQPLAWGYQFGLPWSSKARTAFERRFIGINLASEGGLIDVDGKLYAFDRVSNKTLIRTADVFDFGELYRGYRYFIRYPEPQVTALVQLINRLCDDYEIPRRVPRGFFDYYGQKLARFTGIIGHAMVRGDKTDPAPDREFWERLVSGCKLTRVPIA
jgi:N-acetyl-anhydromuramyl-L-alanine amidase AmpD